MDSCGLIFDIMRFAVHDGPGIRSVVFLKGCPLTCPWCHNPEGMSGSIRTTFDSSACLGAHVCRVEECPGQALRDCRCRPWSSELDLLAGRCPTHALYPDGRWVKVDEVAAELARDESFYRASGGGITLSGGEPLAQPVFARALLEECHRAGWHTVLETTLYADWEEIEHISPLVDLFLVDVKIADARIHRNLCGTDNTVVFENIRRLWKVRSGEGVQFRFPLVGGFTDADHNVSALGKLLSSLGRPSVGILPHHPLASGKRERLGIESPDPEPTVPSPAAIERVETLLQSFGLSVSACTPRPRLTTPESGERVSRLREVALSLSDNKNPFDRPYWFTRGFRESREDEPLIVRRALGIRKLLENLTITVSPDQRILGESLRTIPGMPGIGDEYRWVSAIRNPESWFGASPNVPEDVAAEVEYWRDKGTGKHVGERLPGSSETARKEGLYDAIKNYFGHIIPNFAEALRRGYRDIGREAEAKLAELREDADLDEDRAAFYRAVSICCQGVVTLGRRYCELAESRADAEQDPDHREALLELADLARHVPANAPRTFREALQMVWFVHMLNEEESCAVYTHSFGRFDQYLYPFYQRGMEAGCLTRFEAVELIEEFWVKCYRIFDEQHTMLGGLRPDGTEGVNDLTYVCLEAMRNVALPRAVGVRVHGKAPGAYLSAISDVLEMGMGVPALFNDDVIVPAWTSTGLPIEQARQYAAVGCVELAIPAHAEVFTPALFVNLPKALELSLNGGRSLLSGVQIGPRTIEPEEVRSFDDVLAAFSQQVSHLIHLGCTDEAIAERTIADDQPVPLYSCLIPQCMGSGVDALSRRDNRFTGICISDLATTVNSLAAIRLAVFENGELSLPELVTVLRDDFAGHESMRQRLLGLPKFGNDDPTVDALGALVIGMVCQDLGRQPHPFGGNFIPLIFSRPHRQLEIFGSHTAASADGRHAGKMLAVGLNPTNGSVYRGLTATMRSQNQLPLSRVVGGVSSNLDLDHSVLMGEGEDKIADLLRGWCADGGGELALQISSPRRLREAQKHPDRFPDLAVRVYGFSERFVKLDRATQDYIIERAESATK